VSNEFLNLARRLPAPTGPELDRAALARGSRMAFDALFHAFVPSAAADLVAACGNQRLMQVWRQTYSALDHDAAKST